jgi:PilZ domain
MADGADRREARRFTMSLPMRVLPGEARKSELVTHTRDVSYRGLYFRSETRFEIGSPIDFVITLPQQVTQSGDVNIRCHGQILRVEPGANGSMGVAANIEHYEFVQNAA